MGEGDCEFREMKMVEEGPEIAGDEVVIDERRVFDEMPVRVRQFYFVKVLALENSNLDAMIQAEETIKKMDQEQVLIAQKIRDRQIDPGRVSASLNELWRYDGNHFYIDWGDYRTHDLRLYLNKLNSTNNVCKGKPSNSCLSSGKFDTQKLSSLMLHGCKNMTDERKLLREVNARRDKDGDSDLTVDEVDSPIEPSINRPRYCFTQLDIQMAYVLGGKEAIRDLEIEGKFWTPSSLKKAIQEELQEIYDDVEELRRRQARLKSKIKKTEKELEKVEKYISFLQKQLIYTNRRKAEAYDTILKLKKQYGEENASHYQYRSLMKKVEVLAKKKHIAALKELSQGQVEKFMQQWNSCRKFRNDYKKRVTPSLYRRRLCIDGTMTAIERSQVEETRKVIIPESLSKTRLKWLTEDLVEVLN